MSFPDENEIGAIPGIDFTEADGGTYPVPSTPPAGQLKLYPKSDHLLYIKDSTGTETVLDTGTSGAPATATYITQTPNGTLTNEQPLSALATGILKSTTGTGVVSIASAGTDYLTPSPASSAIDVISAATTTIRPLALKTTDNNTTNNLLEFLSSTNTVLAHVGATGLAAFAGLDSTVIGGVTPAAATVTTLTATTGTFTDLVTITKTTEQLRLRYDSSNYLSFIVSSAGQLSLTPSTDGTTVFGVKNQAATNYGFVYDSTNQRFGVNPLTGDSLTKGFEIFYKDMRFDQIAAPGAPTAALAGLGAGNIDNGNHIYKVTFVTANGETSLGTASSTVNVVDKTTNGQISLTAIPTGAAGLQVTSRNIYRTKAGGSTYFLLTTLADNTTTIYTDNTADASLGATDTTSRNNSTAGTFWLGGTSAGFTRSNNTAWGQNALANLTAGTSNAAFGNATLQVLTTGTNNMGFGPSALAALTTGNNNTAVGSSALSSITTQNNNTAIGLSALQSATSAANTAIGLQAGYTSGSTPASGNAVTTGNNNTFIGFQSGLESSTQRNFAIAIGSGASVDAAQTCIIGGTTTSNSVQLGVGRTTTNAALHITKLDAGTNTVLNVGILDHKSSGSIAANFGIGSLWTGQDSTTADVEFGRLRYYWATATHASRKANGVLSAYDTAERDCIFWGGSGSAPMISFLSVTTPIVQITTGVAAATFVANTSLIANDSATWGGYTVGQIVQALKNYGLLA